MSRSRSLYPWLLPLGLVMAWLVFRRLPADALAGWARGFPGWGIPALVGFEIVSWILMGERWRYLARESGRPVAFGPSQAARAAGFAWSYITPGPHLGGEPVQLTWLARRGIPLRDSLSPLVRDRAWELLGGLLTASWLLVLPGGNRLAGVLFAGLTVAALVFAGTPLRRVRTARLLARIVLPFAGRSPARRSGWYRTIRETLGAAGASPRGRTAWWLLRLSLLLAPLLTLAELALFFHLSGGAPPLRSLMVLTAVSRIAHYAPVPGGLGVYEAGLIGTAVWLGIDPGSAAAYVLFTRIRDLVQVGFGLAATAWPAGETA